MSEKGACRAHSPTWPAADQYSTSSHSWLSARNLYLGLRLPEAIRRFERQWLVNLILWGNFGRLRDLALDSFGQQLDGRSLQVACVYGNLTAHLAARHRHESDLDVIDIIPAQIDNLKRKLGPDSNVNIQLANSAALPHPSATCDRALLFSASRTAAGGSLPDHPRSLPGGQARRQDHLCRLSPPQRLASAPCRDVRHSFPA
jgi:hypothetical protein